MHLADELTANFRRKPCGNFAGALYISCWCFKLLFSVSNPTDKTNKYLLLIATRSFIPHISSTFLSLGFLDVLGLVCTFPHCITYSGVIPILQSMPTIGILLNQCPSPPGQHAELYGGQRSTQMHVDNMIASKLAVGT